MTRQMHDFPATSASGDGVRIEEMAPALRLSLRVRAAHAPVLGRALGLDLPDRVGRTAREASRTALCLGPDEWLICAPQEARGEILAAAAGVYGAAPHALVDISDREISYAITGPQAQALLSIACPRDLDRLEEGQGVRTVFDSAQVVLWRDGAQAFRLDVWRSFALHVRALLDIGQRELAAGL
ncbi:sarcosine oxidase subunit gamma family protein [uncultured Limimaricola sp.]|uniref:sarcosine oxidase subunit gamma n=1 Tax=uncultured Limimaricola sp. TaxID=2211667 RepID=UPI0030F57D8B